MNKPASQEKIAIIGLGYVGLPLALALAEQYETIGYDADAKRVKGLLKGDDAGQGFAPETLKNTALTITDDPSTLAGCSFYIITVPTPIDADRKPDLTHVFEATKQIALLLSKGDVVVYESTVYPGVTEEECGPLIAQHSTLNIGEDVMLGYSPERINPGDNEHSLSQIVKVIAAQDDATLDRLEAVYGSVVEAGLHRAPSIKVAEAAKVIENTQRDINIALMNELSLIFDRMDIRTHEVLEAAATKWNFMPFTPGLVGGHCIGVDPYYLTAKAEQLGYQPQVVLAGRRINDGMGSYIGQKCAKLLVQSGRALKQAKVGVLGLTFKENVSDIRNSRVPDIVRELNAFGIQAQLADPLVKPEAAQAEYDLTLSDYTNWNELDVVILAVPHAAFTAESIQHMIGKETIVMDIKSILNPDAYNHYWSL